MYFRNFKNVRYDLVVLRDVEVLHHFVYFITNRRLFKWLKCKPIIMFNGRK